MIGGIQPRILQQIGPELVDDGLLQRFLMVPMEPAGEEQDYPIEDRIERNYQNLIESLVGFDPKNENGVTIRLSDDAHQYRQQMQDLIQALQTLPGLNYGFRTHVGKMGAIFARLLLTLHMIDQAPVFSLKGDDFYTVTGDTARQAYDLMVKYLIPHGVRQYDRIFEADDNDVRWLAGYIVAKQAQTVTARVCHDASRVFKREPKRAKAAIQVLMDANWLDQDHNVNPRVHELFAERAEHERRTRADLERRITKARTLKKKAFGK
jgi:hypothetical protein